MEAVLAEYRHLTKALRKTMKILRHHAVSSIADLQIHGDQKRMPLYL